MCPINSRNGKSNTYLILEAEIKYVFSQIVSILIHLQLDKLKHRLLRWHEITEKEFPGRSDLLDLIPKSDSINIDKLGNRGTITTDTCNAAQKVRRLLVEHIKGNVNKQDCMQHL